VLGDKGYLQPYIQHLHLLKFSRKKGINGEGEGEEKVVLDGFGSLTIEPVRVSKILGLSFLYKNMCHVRFDLVAVSTRV
jgi:hypothetical protein